MASDIYVSGGGRERLMALAGYIETMSKSAGWRSYFNMSEWFCVDSFDLDHFEDGSSIPVNGACGTAACMLGHAVNVPVLIEAGLGNRLEKGDVVFTLDGRRYTPQQISSMLFGLDRHNHGRIFTQEGYQGTPLKQVTPEMAVAQLRKVVAELDTIYATEPVEEG